MPTRHLTSEIPTLAIWKATIPRTSVFSARSHHYKDNKNIARIYESPSKALKSPMNNDLSSGLREVVVSGGSNIITQILKSQRTFMETKQKSRSWMTPLKVLALRSDSLNQRSTPEQDDKEVTRSNRYFEHECISTARYVALSYVWKPSLHEAKPQHTWQVRDSQSNNGRLCKVRDAVLDRVVRYMRKQGVRHLWVDKECIDSTNTEERQQALQCMDLVYCASDEPLAVLSVPIRTHAELMILQRLLESQLVNENIDFESLIDSEVAGQDSEDDMYRILDLLHRITSDEWWSRAWCFQEEYRSERDMKLLMPHYLDPTDVVSSKVFGDLTDCGELTISSSDFRRTATQFIFAYVAAAQRKGKTFDRGTCLQILGRAGDYAVINQYGHILGLDAKGKSMSTLVLNDLQHKNYTISSDMLNIAANCNIYYRTMNTALIDKFKASMSITMLTMWFLNGEIFWNGGIADPGHGQKAWLEDQNVFTHLNSLAFDACPDIGEQSTLAYRRKLRFLRPKLMSKGVETYGHLFRLTEVIELDTATVQSSAEPAQVLKSIASQLQSTHPIFAARLELFVTEEFSQNTNETARASRHAMSLSASNLVARLREKPCLAFGVLANRGTGETATSGEVDAGIFAVGDVDLSAQSSYVFTSWQQESRGAPWYKNQPEEDKYVSLKVSVDGGTIDSASPFLRTEAWVDGLCFYEGATQHPYTFPWPKYFYPR